MNINQNFKNQLWAAQQGLPNGRVVFENELSSRDFNIKYQFGELLDGVLNDTIPEKTDSVLAYVLIKGTADERIMTSPVFIEKSKFADAQTNFNNLVVANNESKEIPGSQVNDFVQLQTLEMQLAQTPDSLQPALVMQNELWLQTIAADSLHFGQSDAIAMLELYTDTVYPRYIWLESPTMRMQNKPFVSENNDTCGFSIAPNPANTVVNIEVATEYVQEGNVIEVYDNNGRKLNEFNVVSSTGQISLNVSHYVKGNYYISLKNGNETICVKPLVVE